MFDVLKQILKVVVITLSVPTVAILIQTAILSFKTYYKDGKIRPEYKGDAKQDSFFKKLFVQLPKILAHDIMNNDPNEFKEYGLHMFIGKQGTGKTSALVHTLMYWQKKYPYLKVNTNMGYKYEDGEINHWRDMVNCENGKMGIANVLDEIQTWFSSQQSKDFPPEMLGEISQQRKQRKCTMGTAQVFGKIAKPIREQTTHVYLPKTFFGCVTIIRRTEPEYYDSETGKFTKMTGFEFFVHTLELRNAFDTYKRIKKYSEQGFKPESEIMREAV